VNDQREQRSARFIADFCTADGAIDWPRLVAFNSSRV